MEKQKGGAPKGHKKVGGRKKGTPNKVTKELREWVSDLLDSNREKIVQDLAVLEPDKRLAFLEKLMSYVIPKKQDTTLGLINKLSDDDLDKVVDEILTKME